MVYLLRCLELTGVPSNQQTKIQNKLKEHTKISQTYESEVHSKLDNIIKLAQSQLRRINDDNDENPFNWKGTSEDLAYLAQTFRSWRPHLLEFHKTERIITSLDFNQVEERRNAIADAHHSTYAWIFNTEKVNMMAWLAAMDAPIYWVAGNAGAGKSTLMKFIHKHPSMLERIRLWAGDRTLHIASHSFWMAGTPMQQSQEGLLRSLLLQMLLEHPELSQNMFPARWKTANNFLDHSRTLVWSTKELHDAFLRLPETIGKECLFIFIDGLDEYCGEPEDLNSRVRRAC